MLDKYLHLYGSNLTNNHWVELPRMPRTVVEQYKHLIDQSPKGIEPY